VKRAEVRDVEVMRLPGRRRDRLQLALVDVAADADREDVDAGRLGEVSLRHGPPAVGRGRPVGDEDQQARYEARRVSARAVRVHLGPRRAQRQRDVRVAAADVQSADGVHRVVNVVVVVQTEADLDVVAELEQAHLHPANVHVHSRRICSG